MYPKLVSKKKNAQEMWFGKYYQRRAVLNYSNDEISF